jgi:sigma-B regulation protein RsbU (phosphoserine phosphatase)
VTGKGIAAALFMARTITQLRMEAMRKRSPSTILEAVNRALCEGNDAGMFVTIFCGILELDTGQFGFANAGHNPPLHLGADGGHVFLVVKKGLVAGILENAHYPMDAIRLQRDELLLLYTDGVTEALNPADEFYSEPRFLDSVRDCDWTDPRTLVEAVRASIAEFAQNAPQADDITMLALRYRGTAA